MVGKHMCSCNYVLPLYSISFNKIYLNFLFYFFVSEDLVHQTKQKYKRLEKKIKKLIIDTKTEVVNAILLETKVKVKIMSCLTRYFQA